MTRTEAGRVTAGLFVTLDGVAQAPEQWQGPYFTPEVGATVSAQLAAADVLLLGRRTYEEFAEYWPQVTAADNPMAERINTMPKLVASTTLADAAWQHTAVVSGDVAAELRRRTSKGQTVQVTGSITLVQSLLAAGLLDELSLLVHPLVLGAGQRLFTTGGIPGALTLGDCQRYSSGIVGLTYRSAS